MTDAEKREAYCQALNNLASLQNTFSHYLSGKRIQQEICPADFEKALEALVGSSHGPESRVSFNGTLSQLEAQARRCTACKLHMGRNKVVFGSGVMQPQVMIIGEGPGHDEDLSGEPFVGRAGRYLDTWLAAIGLNRQEHLYIANIVKCRPPGNRDPEGDEIEACLPFLKRQVELIKPKTILCLGRTAAHNLLGVGDSLQQLRSRWFRFESIPTLVTYHPSAVLRNSALRAPVWEDLQRLAAYLELELHAQRSR